MKTKLLGMAAYCTRTCRRRWEVSALLREVN